MEIRIVGEFEWDTRKDFGMYEEIKRTTKRKKERHKINETQIKEERNKQIKKLNAIQRKMFKYRKKNAKKKKEKTMMKYEDK